MTEEQAQSKFEAEFKAEVGMSIQASKVIYDDVAARLGLIPQDVYAYAYSEWKRKNKIVTKAKHGLD